MPNNDVNTFVVKEESNVETEVLFVYILLSRIYIAATI